MKERREKKWLSFFLSVVLMCTMLPGNWSFAEEKSKVILTGFEELEELDYETIVQGTKLEDLELPKELIAYGYDEETGDESQASEIRVEVEKWQVKEKDAEEKIDYSIELATGTYTFFPVIGEEYKLAKDVKLPRYKLKIVEPETEPITEAPTE
ncbi:MAG: hypothetical protein Q4F41_21265, partial [Eubacteriales bacterium]|nr:hypothetical protein [Eubacteriales bacterium]